MDLYCAESLSLSSKHAYPDPVMFAQSAGMDVDETSSSDCNNEQDCLQTLHAIEHVWTPKCDYFNNQPDLKPFMRKMVVEWLLEVCKEQHCEDEVFPVTVNLMDRFLAVQPIPKTEFQLLASSCLLVASKLRETASLPAEKICKYTENSIILDQLYAYEMFVLDRLQWDLGVITAHELSDHLMYRLFSDPTAPIFYRIRRHCRALLDLAQTDFAFALKAPSLLAASAIMSSLSHFGFSSEQYEPQGDDNSIFQQVGDLVGVQADYLSQCSIELTGLRDAFIAHHQSPPQQQQQSPISSSSPDSGHSSLNTSSSSTTSSNQNNKQSDGETTTSLPSTPARPDDDTAHPQTPTDVADLFDE